jgi:alkylation response protein AidB-like acyl-CoA dehydrogenase
MRTAIESNALRVLQLAERCVGARGLMRPEPFERLHRDLTHYLRQAAPDAAVVAAGEFALASPEAAHALWAE